MLSVRSGNSSFVHCFRSHIDRGCSSHDSSRSFISIDLTSHGRHELDHVVMTGGFTKTITQIGICNQFVWDYGDIVSRCSFISPTVVIFLILTANVIIPRNIHLFLMYSSWITEVDKWQIFCLITIRDNIKLANHFVDFMKETNTSISSSVYHGVSGWDQLIYTPGVSKAY